MKRMTLLLVPLLVACGGGDAEKTLKGEAGDGTRSEESGSGTGERPARITGLTGLYEAGAGSGRAEMCMTSTADGAASFGIVSETPGGAGCGGAGEAVREGDRLRLTMTGDEACVIPAQISGRQVRFPATLPAGCDYYCGPGATLGGTILEKTGDTSEDAKRARDLAGDPLCG